MPTSLIEFYTEVLLSLGLVVDDEGFIYIKGSSKNVLLMSNGKPMVLPTENHLETLLDKDEDGKFVIKKIPFNVLNENSIKGDSASLTKVKTIVENRIAFGISVAGSLLLQLASNNELQRKYGNITLNKFLGELNSVKKPNMKTIVDEKMIESWSKIYSDSGNSKEKIVSVFLKKQGKYDNTTYNRLAVMDSPIYLSLLSMDKNNDTLCGVRLRNKDMDVFKLILEFLLPQMDKNNLINIGSKDNTSPGFIALFTLYIDVSEKILKVIEDLKELDKDYYDTAYYSISITKDMLTQLGVYASELRKVPNDSELQMEVTKKVTQPTQQPVHTSQAYPNTPQDIREEEPMSNKDILNSILYGNASGNRGYMPREARNERLATVDDIQRGNQLPPRLNRVYDNYDRGYDRRDYGYSDPGLPRYLNRDYGDPNDGYYRDDRRVVNNPNINYGFRTWGGIYVY